MFLDSEWLRDDPPHTVAHAVKLKPKADGQPSTVNDASDIDTGYTAEIRIPWRPLGIPRTAETWRQENGKRVAGPWNLEGQSVSLLAVLQDGDLPERYHHSGPKRKPDWFHKTQPDWPVYECASAEKTAAAEVRRLLADQETGSASSATVDALRTSGIAAALAAAGFLVDVIAAAAKCRRMHSEILRIYDPAAFELFYSPAAAAAQQPLATGLAWKKWPRSLPEAVVRSAPLPTLDWLKSQAAAASPDLAKLRLMFPAVGWWLRAGNERQHAEEFCGVVATLAENSAVAADPPTAAALP